MTARLNPNEFQALQAFLQCLEHTYPEQRPRFVLYGSKARGDSTADSDIDVLVLLRQEDRAVRRDILTIAARVSLEYDVLLNPCVIGEARFSQQRDFSFYRNATKEGVSLALEGEQLVLV